MERWHPKWNRQRCLLSVESEESELELCYWLLQTRQEEMGLEDSQVYDTENAVKVAVEAMRKLIKKDKEK